MLIRTRWTVLALILCMVATPSSMALAQSYAAQQRQAELQRQQQAEQARQQAAQARQAEQARQQAAQARQAEQARQQAAQVRQAEQARQQAAQARQAEQARQQAAQARQAEQARQQAAQAAQARQAEQARQQAAQARQAEQARQQATQARQAEQARQQAAQARQAEQARQQATQARQAEQTRAQRSSMANAPRPLVIGERMSRVEAQGGKGQMYPGRPANVRESQYRNEQARLAAAGSTAQQAHLGAKFAQQQSDLAHNEAYLRKAIQEGRPIIDRGRAGGSNDAQKLYTRTVGADGRVVFGERRTTISPNYRLEMKVLSETRYPNYQKVGVQGENGARPYVSPVRTGPLPRRGGGQ